MTVKGYRTGGIRRLDVGEFLHDIGAGGPTIQIRYVSGVSTYQVDAGKFSLPGDTSTGGWKPIYQVDGS